MSPVKIVLFGLLAITVLLAILLRQPNKKPGPWMENFHLEIARALVAKRITGCGEFKWRERRGDSEYEVQCTADGQRWIAYRVWPKIKEVTGPFAPGYVPE